MRLPFLWALNDRRNFSQESSVGRPERSRPAQGTVLGAHARLDWRGLRRHRHEPPLCGPRVRGGRSRRRQSGERNRRARHPFAHHLGADPHRYGKVCRDSVTRRQQWGRRHAGADGAGASGGGGAWRRHRHSARHHQRRPVLWRREHHVVPLTVVILIALFAVQSRGTARVAAFFGPVTLVWFIAIAIAGLWHVAQNLAVLYAFNPIHGVEFLASHGLIGLITLGAVFLAVTGSEALYADLGHFGRGPIRTAWLSV